MIGFERLIRRLYECKVSYTIVGGLAAVARGSAYITADLDICYLRSKENYQAIQNAFKDLHPRLRGAPGDIPFQLDAKTISVGLNFTLITDWGDVDLLGEISGIGNYNKVLEKSEYVKLFEVGCHILSIEGLIKAKKAAGRPKDVAHLKELEALLELKKR